MPGHEDRPEAVLLTHSRRQDVDGAERADRSRKRHRAAADEQLEGNALLLPEQDILGNRHIRHQAELLVDYVEARHASGMG